MVDNTHGLYVPLKKKLFDGAMYDKPDLSLIHIFFISVVKRVTLIELP